MSSAVPIVPSAPALYTVIVRGKNPVAPFAMRSGSSPGASSVPAIRSAPTGNLIVAVTSLTVRPDWRFAPFETITRALKYWCRNPMLPGITTTPGIGGS